MTLELKRHTLNFSFPDVHEDAKVGISFQRTLRIPDNDKEYPLPPGLGTFPVKLVDDHKDRVPAKWVERGGVMFPMFQSEAMWINFHRSSAYPFAIKIATGKVSAITGEPWAVGLKPKDYVVIPEQPWLDGYVVEKDIVRQFVAAPLGAGFTAEEQISGKSEHGGIQIEVIPMKKEVYERRFPKRSSILRGTMTMDYCLSLEPDDCYAVGADMGLAPGGRMKQQIHEDPFDFDDWDVTNRQRVFVHIANSLVWKAITKYDPPHPAPTAESYTSAGLPWFEHYKDDAKVLKGTDILAAMKSVMAMGFQKGFGILPENADADIKPEQVTQLKGQAPEPQRGPRRPLVMDTIDQLLKDIDEQLAQGVTDPVRLLETSAQTIRTLRLEALQAKAPCLSCGHTPGPGSGVGPGME